MRCWKTYFSVWSVPIALQTSIDLVVMNYPTTHMRFTMWNAHTLSRLIFSHISFKLKSSFLSFFNLANKWIAFFSTHAHTFVQFQHQPFINLGLNPLQLKVLWDYHSVDNINLFQLSHIPSSLPPFDTL